MSWKKIKSIAKRALIPGHASRKQFKSLRKHLGLTSKSKWLRSVKRSMGIGKDSYFSQPVSASTVGYQHNARTLSQLTGGV